MEVEGAVERGLAAHRGQEGVGLLGLDDLLDDFRGDRFDIGRVGQVRVGHDRRRIGIDEDDAVAFGLQRLDRLDAGIVELAGLSDDDRAGTNYQDRRYVGALRHGRFLLPVKRVPDSWESRA